MSNVGRQQGNALARSGVVIQMQMRGPQHLAIRDVYGNALHFHGSGSSSRFRSERMSSRRAEAQHFEVHGVQGHALPFQAVDWLCSAAFNALSLMTGPKRSACCSPAPPEATVPQRQQPGHSYSCRPTLPSRGTSKGYRPWPPLMSNVRPQ